MNHISYIESSTVRRRAILGLDVSCFSYGDALSFANQMASLPIGQTVLSFLNANNANIMYADPEYRATLSRQIIFPDGVGVDLAATFVYGQKFPANLNGTDFVPALLTYMDRPKRVGLIGGRPGVAEAAAANFKRHAPWHEFIVVSDGYFDPAASSKVTKRLDDLSLDVLLVGLGSPKQEKWVDAHIRAEHARLVICVGALFDFVSQVVPRAPKLLRRLRLEWLFRLAVEPKRLWRRYVVGNPLFLARTLRQAFVVRVLGKRFPSAQNFGAPH
jgi:exopolysaccharide biosynthesis WecB/TagA/CpsF family protein